MKTTATLRWLLTALAAVAFALAPIAETPALALTGNVYGYGTTPCKAGTTPCYWGPARIVLSQGDSVVFRNASGTHGLAPQNSLGSKWPASCPAKDLPTAGYTCTFSAAGNYVYWCRRHGQVMTGTIVVVVPRSAGPIAVPSPFRFPSPSPSPGSAAAGSNKSGAPDPVLPTLVVIVAIVAVGFGVRALREQRRKRR